MADTNRAKRVLGIGVTVLLGVLVLLSAYLLIARVVFHDPLPRVFGYAGAVVLSGSMSDTIEANDLVIVREQDEYAVDDVITYVADGRRPVTHRIIAKTQDGYLTQGDANNTPDPEILEEQIIGRVVAVVPWVGSIRTTLVSPVGLSLVLLGIALFVFYRLRVKSPALTHTLSNEDTEEPEKQDADVID